MQNMHDNLYHMDTSPRKTSDTWTQIKGVQYSKQGEILQNMDESASSADTYSIHWHGDPPK